MMIALLILFPFLGFVLNGALHLFSIRRNKKITAEFSGTIATLVMFASFAVSVYLFFLLRDLPEGGRVFEQVLFHWMTIGRESVDFSLRFDSLSSVFALIITGVGTLIHLYSISYMHDDKTPAKYFSFLNLFCFMMLNLVLGATLPHVFLGWEGVGLASYLLIGYWYEDFKNVIAGQKAFIMNRIGDVAFLIAMFIAYHAAGTLDLIHIQPGNFDAQTLPLFGIFIFFACTGKSAQIPLFTWLPDAMAGPTPVSALIHAATMVTSGVYLLTRLAPVISASDFVLTLIASVGVATAFVSALMACAQKDIKKILAYSTISQLGFMFLACGVSAFDVGVFHVMTHAFFKALLFLGAGSVIHSLQGEQDIFKMGGLRKKLPWTFWTFALGWGAILGLPPASGFFSKDEILYRALVSPHGHGALFVFAVFSAFLTAFYMTRLFVLVFFGSSRVDSKKEAHIHESSSGMTIPLVILGILSLIGGWWGAPIHLLNQIGGADLSELHSIEWVVMIGSVLIAGLGALLAMKQFKTVTSPEKEMSSLSGFLKNGMKVDQFYLSFFGKGTARLSQGLFRYIEEFFIQRLMNWSSSLVELSSSLFKTIQTGSAHAYLMLVALAIFSFLAWFFFGVGQYGKL